MSDPFTQRRLVKFIGEFRARSGQLPTIRDLQQAGFGRDAIEVAVKEGKIEEFYITLTNGTVVKGFKAIAVPPEAL